jgi:hypothetical protein
MFVRLRHPEVGEEGVGHLRREVLASVNESPCQPRPSPYLFKNRGHFDEVGASAYDA